MDLLSATISDREVNVNKIDKKQEWTCRATYISGYSDLAGKFRVAIKFDITELAVYKIGFLKGEAELLFKIPVNRIVSVIGDGTYHPSSDDQSTKRPMIIAAAVEDKNGDQHRHLIEFDTYLPWVIIPKLRWIVDQSRDISV